MSRPIGTAAELERRRRRAVALVARGESRADVARILGVHPKTLARWLRLARQPHGLDAKPLPGPAPGLSDAHNSTGWRHCWRKAPGPTAGTTSSGPPPAR